MIPAVTSRVMRKSAVLLAVATVLLGPVVPVLAHTEFESSAPADQEIVEAPVSEISVVFTLPVTIVGNGFEVLDPDGDIITPRVETSDDTVFTIILDEPLTGGDVGVRYEVEAEDGHVLAGGFSFTVSASSPTPTTAGVTSTTVAVEPATTVDATGPSTAAPTTSVPEGREGGSMAPLLIGIGVLVLGGAGLYAGMRSRS